MKKTSTRKTKKTAKTSRPRIVARGSRPGAPPFGLMLLFSMVRDPHTTQVAATLEAQRALPLALSLIDRLHSLEEREAAGILPEDVEPMFGCELDDPEEPSHVADASFRIGLATAWALIQGMQGREVSGKVA